MSFAVSTWICQDCSTEEAVDILAGSGFAELELSGTGSALMSAWQTDGPGTTARLARHGLKATSVHCSKAGRVGLGSSDRDERDRAVQENMSFLRNMAESGVQQLILHPEGVARSMVASGHPSGAAVLGWDDQHLRDSLSRLADCAGELGLVLAVENMQSAVAAFTTMDSLLDLIGGLGGHVGLCHDVGHSLLAGLDAEREMRRALRSGRLFSLHLHHVSVDEVDHLLLPQGGQPDLNVLLADLDKAQFPGQKTIELRPNPAVDPRSVLQSAAKVFLGRF